MADASDADDSKKMNAGTLLGPDGLGMSLETAAEMALKVAAVRKRKKSGVVLSEAEKLRRAMVS